MKSPEFSLRAFFLKLLQNRNLQLCCTHLDYQLDGLGSTDLVAVDVSLNISAPVAGEEAVFEAEYAFPTGERYEIGAAEGIDAVNGIRWIDGNNQKALRPGDKFQSGHYYKALIYVKAGTGCRFADNMTASVSDASDVYVSTYSNPQTYAQYDPLMYRVVVAEFDLEGEYDIYVENGYAYDAEGNIILLYRSFPVPTRS